VKAELLKEINRQYKVINDDSYVIQPFERHASNLQEAAWMQQWTLCRADHGHSGSDRRISNGETRFSSFEKRFREVGSTGLKESEPCSTPFVPSLCVC
jgi:hypothetical protein